MNAVPVACAIAAAAIVAGCAKPAQLGGLGVFNPNGFEGRMALASEYRDNQAKSAERGAGKAERLKVSEVRR